MELIDMKNYFKIRCISIVLMSTGYGWAGGHFIPSDSTFISYLFQFVVIGILLWLSSHYIYDRVNASPRKWTSRGLSIFSIISFAINILNIIHGAFNHDPHSFGSHNSLADLVPIGFLVAGSGLWILITLLEKTGNSTAITDSD